MVLENVLQRASLWTATTPNGTVGTFTDLPPLAEVPDDPDHLSNANGINTAAQVGTSTYYADGGEDGGTQILERGHLD